MVYLLKWLISLITPHTHDKEGKQGNSFIVRKALGNRASFSSLASKKGSSLLLVVMTMSVIIVISSSFMLLSFNTGIGSIFASSQQKAQLSCLSVAEGLKDGNTFAEVYSNFNKDGTWNVNEERKIYPNSPDLYGSTEVVLTKLSSIDVHVLVKTTVGKSSYTLQFTNRLANNAVRDVISQVSNAMTLSGGGSFSMHSDKVVGDLSLDGDYLLAMRGYKENGSDYTSFPCTIEGNVYCNGDLVLGYKGAAVEVYHDKTGIGSVQHNDDNCRWSTSIPTIITKSLYVNGNLVINACDIEGDVYVSGNVLVNGITDEWRGNEEGNGATSSSNAIIKGNLYVGGSLYVTSGSFARFFPDDEKIQNDYQSGNQYSGGYTYRYSDGGINPKQAASCYKNGFPKFPTETEIKFGSTDYVLKRADTVHIGINKKHSENVKYDETWKEANSFAALYSKTVASEKGKELYAKLKSNDEYIEYKKNDGSTFRLYREFLKRYGSNGKINFNGDEFSIGDYDTDKIFKNKCYAQIEGDLGNKVIVIHAKVVTRWRMGGWDKEYDNDEKSTERAYNALFNVLSGSWINNDDSFGGSDDNGKARTLTYSVIREYERWLVNNYQPNSSVENWVNCFSENQRFVVKGNAYVQNNAEIQCFARFDGKTYINGSLVSYNLNNLYNRNQSLTNNYYAPQFNGKLFVKKANTKNYVVETKQIVKKEASFYNAYMALCGDENSSPVKEKKDPAIKFEGGKWYKFYDSTKKSHDEFVLSGSMKDYQTANGSTRFTAGKITGNAAEEGKTLVKGIFAYGAYATCGRVDEKLEELPNYDATSFDFSDKNKMSALYAGNGGNMYSSEFMENHADKYVAMPEMYRSKTPRTVADVFKEMGVYGYSAEGINGKDYQGTYRDASNGDYYYGNLFAEKKYREGLNKMNDPKGVNFTGVKGSTEIRFGYTLEKAITAVNSGNTVVVDSFADMLTKLKNVSDANKVADALKNLEASEVGVYYTDKNGGFLWGVGAKTYYHITIKKSVLINFDFDMREQNIADFNIDTSAGDINVFFACPDHGMLDIKGTIQTLCPTTAGSVNMAYIYILPTILYSTNYTSIMNGSTPTETLKLGFDDNNTFGLYDSNKVNHIGNIMSNEVKAYSALNNGIPTKDTDGQYVYHHKESGSYYKYSICTTHATGIKQDGGNEDGKDQYTLAPQKFSNFVFMRSGASVKNSAVKNGDKVSSAAIPMILSEGPTLFLMYGGESRMNGILYLPNSGSAFFCGSSSTAGTAADNGGAGQLDGGAIIVGTVYGTTNAKSVWKYYAETLENGSQTINIGEKIAEVMRQETGLGGIQTANGDNSNVTWIAGGYE